MSFENVIILFRLPSLTIEPAYNVRGQKKCSWYQQIKWHTIGTQNTKRLPTGSLLIIEIIYGAEEDDLEDADDDEVPFIEDEDDDFSEDEIDGLPEGGSTDE